MAKRKKHGGDPPLGAEDESAIPKPSGPVGTSLRELLKGVEVPKEAAKRAPEKRAQPAPAPRAAPAPLPAPTTPGARPSETLRGPDRTAYLDALAGVRPMRGRLPPRIGAVAKPAAPPTPAEARRDDEARARLASLVAGGVKFDVQRDDGWIEGLRRDAKPAVIKELRKAQIAEDATLDLHGLRAQEAEDRLSRFLRDAQRAGVRRMCVVHGRGLHSEGGVAVLAEVVVRTLTQGAGAPLVVAFVTAPPSQGGEGALLVELTRR